jgi:hypothetical protein
MADVPDALAVYKWGNSQVAWGNVFGCFGVGFMTLGIVYVIETGDVDDGGFEFCEYFGLGVTAFAAYLIIKGGLDKATAVSIYNNARRNTSSLQLNFGVTRSGGIGLTLNF